MVLHTGRAPACRTIGGKSMSEEALMTGLVGAGEKVDALWNMFITVHMAIFGFYLLNKRKLGWPEVAVAFVGYLGFAWINANALIYTYDLLGGFYAQYRIQYGNPDRFAKLLYSALIDKEFSSRASVVWSVHAAAICIVAVALRSLCTQSRLLDTPKQSHVGSLPLAEADRALQEIDAATPIQQAAPNDTASSEHTPGTPPPNPYQPPDKPDPQIATEDAPQPTRVPGYDPKQDDSGMPALKDVNPDPVLTDELAKALRRAQTNAQDARKSAQLSPHKRPSDVAKEAVVDADYRHPRNSTR